MSGYCDGGVKACGDCRGSCGIEEYNGYLEAAADVYAIAKVYEREGDSELLRRVVARIERDGYSEQDVLDAMRRKAQNMTPHPEQRSVPAAEGEDHASTRPDLGEIERRALAQVGDGTTETVWNVLARDVLALLAHIRAQEERCIDGVAVKHTFVVESLVEPLTDDTPHAEDCQGCEIDRLRAERDSLAEQLQAAERREEALRGALAEYADHQSWRCAYRSRYGECRCGLDETMQRLGLPSVDVIDPEARAALNPDQEVS